MSIFGLRSNSLASSAYKNLSRTQGSLNDNISRLASGLRINKAADNSTGSAISTRMNSQITGMKQANRNTQDTHNLLATAESGLSDISDILSKMRELSVQASTDTLNDVDRASINLEFQSLKDELTRISNATEYNNMNVLNGSYQSNNGRGQWRIQIGADNDVNNQHQVSVMDSTATGLGLRSEVKATDLPSLVDAIYNNEIEVHIDKTTGNFTDPSNSNAVKLESDGSSLYVVGMKSTTLSSDIDASNNGGNIVVADPTGFDSGGGTVVINGDEGTYSSITTTSTRKLEITSSNTGTFTDSGQSLGESNSRKVSLGDVDGDGDLDAFVANQGQGNKVWVNDSNGNFTDSGQSLGESNSEGVSLGDVDDDGDLDAFVGNHNQADKVWINDGSGNFTDSGQSLGDSESYGVELGDVDNDGDLDAFVGKDGKVWINDGNATFADSGQSLGGSRSIGVALGDMDNDGDLDAFVTHRFPTEDHEVWLNDGVGNFTDSRQSISAGYSISVSLGDVDGDNDLDAFVTHGDNQYIQGNKVWINDGNATFTLGQSLGASPSIVASFGDVDGDGDLDAFVANSYSPGHANKVWINDGNGTFTDSGQSLGLSLSDGVSLGDVDGDGDLDAFVTNINQPNKVWINERADVGDITLNQAATGNYTLTYGGSDTFSLSRDGRTAVDYTLTVDPASTGSSETATFNLDGNDINIELKQNYAQLDGNDFTFNVQNTTTHQLTGLSGIDQSHRTNAPVLSVHTVNNVGLVASTGLWTIDVNGLFNNVNGNGGVTDISQTNGYSDSSYDTNVLSVDDARTAITAIDHAIDEVNRERSYIGSEQNKLQFTMSNLTSQTQSIEAARSSIQDTDFAADAADLAKNQILAQSATAMLAQASAISQNILSLLR